jgi:hypothetical protein
VNVDGIGDTWLGTVWRSVTGLGPGLIGGAAVVVVLVVIGVTMLRYVAKGGGQYGIIEGYVGTIGAGKTTLAVQHALELARARNAVLLSNIPVICLQGRYERGLRLGGWVMGMRYHAGCADGVHVIEHRALPVTDDGLDLGVLTREAFALRDAGRGLVLLMDEVGVIMPARLWKDFSVSLMWVLQQSRKLACEWVWTAQDVAFVDSQLRSLTAVVHYVRSYPPPSIWRRARGKRPWLLIASAFTPMAAPRANSEGMKVERRLGRRIRRYRREWEAAFDTDGVVLPSRHLRGAEALVGALEQLGDAHVIPSASASFGEYVRVEAETAADGA